MAVFFPLSLQSATISLFKDQAQFGLDYSKVTHVYVVGDGDKSGDLFFKAALSRAMKARDVYGNSRQYVFYGPKLVDAKSSYFDEYSEYSQTLERLKLKPLFFDQSYQNSKGLIQSLKEYSQVAALEFFTHTAPAAGAFLDSSSSPQRHRRFNHKIWFISSLKKIFHPHAYVFFHGCNSGFKLGPAFAKKWNVPVIGSLSFTNFQEIYEGRNFRNWYFNDRGLYPGGASLARTNYLSYLHSNESCFQGACVRMKPEPYPYKGYWGKFNAGLSHYKVFCGEENPSDHCKKVMALSLLQHPGSYKHALSSLSAYKAAVKEFLCPDANRVLAKKQCFAVLEASLQNPNLTSTGLVRGKTLNCNFEECDTFLNCTSLPGSCFADGPENPNPRTMIREFRAYVEGYLLLKSE